MSDREKDAKVARAIGWRVDGLCPDGKWRGVSPVHLTMMGTSTTDDLDIIPDFWHSDTGAVTALRTLIERDNLCAVISLWKDAARVTVYNPDGELTRHQCPTLPAAICTAIEALAEVEA